MDEYAYAPSSHYALAEYTRLVLMKRADYKNIIQNNNTESNFAVYYSPQRESL